MQQRSGLAVPSRSDLLGWALFALLAAVFWHCDILSNTSEFPVFTGFDLFTEFFPRHHYAGAALRDGRLPLWDPTQAAGLPFVATWQAGFFYPPNLLYAVLPTEVAMGILGRFHIFLCGVFAWLLARELRLGRAAAALVAVTYMLCGSTVFTIYQTCAINSAPWLPAALWCAWRLGEKPGARAAVWLAAVVALQFMAGREFALVMTLNAVALLTLFQVAWHLRDAAPARAAARHLGYLAAAGLLTAGLVAIQALPTIELAARSERPLEGLPAFMLEPFGPMTPRLFLANLVLPVRGPIRREYLGWIPLVFALIGLLEVRRRRAAAYFGALAAVSLLLVFGSQTPLYSLYTQLPLGAVFRLPDRFVFLFSLGVAVLAGFGFDRLFDQRAGSAARRPWPWAAIVVVGSFYLLLAAAITTRWLRAGVHEVSAPWGWFTFYGLSVEHFGGLGMAAPHAAAALLLISGGWWFATGARATRIKLLLVSLAALDLLFAFRSVTLHPEADVAQAVSAAACYRKAQPLLDDYGRHLSLSVPDSYALKAKDGELFGTHSATHYDPLVSRRHAEFFRLLQEDGTPIFRSPWLHTSRFMGMLTHGPRPGRLKLLDLLGVRVVLADGRSDRPPGAFDVVFNHYEPYDSCMVDSVWGLAPVVLLANRDAMPRASVLFDAIEVAGLEAATEVLGRSNFEPSRTVVVETGGPLLLPRRDAHGSATIVEYSENRVVVDVTTSAPGVLLLTDSWDPDWSATVDGRPVRIHPADVLFRSVVVGEGDSRVVFEYNVRGVRVGAVVSASSLLLMLMLLVWTRPSAPATAPADDDGENREPPAPPGRTVP